MKKIGLWVSMMLYVIALCGQDNNSAAEIILAERSKMEEAVKKLSTPTIKKNHNLFLDPSWQNSAVVTNKGEVLYFNGRYSVLDKAIELKINESVRTIRAARVKAAMIGDQNFIVVPAEHLGGDMGDSFFEVLSLGKINLYKLHLLKTRMTGSNALTTSVNGEKEYFVSHQLYYHRPGQQCEKLKGSSKKMMLLFKEHNKEIEEFSDQNNLNLKVESDLIQLFEFYNSLESE